MSEILNDISRTFNEYLLLPNLTDERCIPSNVSLKTPLTKFKKGEEPELSANIPFVSAIMQAVSGEKMAIALAREGGCSFIYGSQSIESEAQMVRDVKKCKAGFIDSDSNVKVGTPLRDVIDLVNRTGHSTVMVTEDGTSKGKFIGLVTDKDYRITRADLDEPIDKFMVPKEKIVFARKGISLEEANDVIWENKVSCLPILDEDDNLEFLVFRKDYEDRKNNPNSLLDENKRYIVGAVGNFIDRIFRNYVVDFFYFELINFPIFNVADIYVTCGAALFFIVFIFVYKEEDVNEMGRLLFPWKKKDKNGK